MSYGAVVRSCLYGFICHMNKSVMETDCDVGCFDKFAKYLQDGTFTKKLYKSGIGDMAFRCRTSIEQRKEFNKKSDKGVHKKPKTQQD